MFSYDCEDIVTLFNNSLIDLSKEFHPILNFKIPHKELMKFYNFKMVFIAPFNKINGQTLSEALFEYVSFDPYNKRPGKEIDESYFVANVHEAIDKMKESNSEQELKSLMIRIGELITGFSKANMRFQLMPIKDVFSKMREVRLSIDQSNILLVRAFNHLGKYMDQLLFAEKNFIPEIKKIQENMASQAENLLESLILSSYQPNFKESYVETYKLRAFEIIYFIKMIYNYEGLDQIDVAVRTMIVEEKINKSLNGIYNLVFDDIENGNIDLHNKRVRLLNQARLKILNYFTLRPIRALKRELRNLRLNVENPQMQNQQLQLENKEIQNQAIQVEKEELQNQAIQVENEQVQNQVIQVQKNEIENQEPEVEEQEIENEQLQFEKQENKNNKLLVKKQEIQIQQPQVDKKEKKNQKLQAKIQQMEIQKSDENKI